MPESTCSPSCCLASACLVAVPVLPGPWMLQIRLRWLTWRAVAAHQVLVARFDVCSDLLGCCRQVQLTAALAGRAVAAFSFIPVSPLGGGNSTWPGQA